MQSGIKVEAGHRLCILKSGGRSPTRFDATLPIRFGSGYYRFRATALHCRFDALLSNRQRYAPSVSLTQKISRQCSCRLWLRLSEIHYLNQWLSLPIEILCHGNSLLKAFHSDRMHMIQYSSLYLVSLYLLKRNKRRTYYFRY